MVFYGSTGMSIKFSFFFTLIFWLMFGRSSRGNLDETLLVLVVTPAGKTQLVFTLWRLKIGGNFHGKFARVGMLGDHWATISCKKVKRFAEPTFRFASSRKARNLDRRIAPCAHHNFAMRERRTNNEEIRLGKVFYHPKICYNKKSVGRPWLGARFLVHSYVLWCTIKDEQIVWCFSSLIHMYNLCIQWYTYIDILWVDFISSSMYWCTIDTYLPYKYIYISYIIYAILSYRMFPRLLVGHCIVPEVHRLSGLSLRSIEVCHGVGWLEHVGWISGLTRTDWFGKTIEKLKPESPSVYGQMYCHAFIHGHDHWVKRGRLNKLFIGNCHVCLFYHLNWQLMRAIYICIHISNW